MIKINQPELLNLKGPVILAANHPNSFLDAVVLAALFKEPIYSLARGDAFVSKTAIRILASLNMLPVYRISEGSENIRNNYDTFGKVHELLSQNKIVLIFSEGLCINEWHLRPLKKGTARISFSAWNDEIKAKVLPVGINYSSFRHYGKNLIINFGKIIESDQWDKHETGKNITSFNRVLSKELSDLVYEIPLHDIGEREKIFGIPGSRFRKAILFLPAMIGYFFFTPFYFVADLIIRNRANVHYDSVMVGIMLLFSPFYIILITIACYFLTGSMLSFLLPIVMPLTTLALIHYRKVVR